MGKQRGNEQQEWFEDDDKRCREVSAEGRALVVADNELQLPGTAGAERTEEHSGRAAVRHLGAARHARVVQIETREQPGSERGDMVAANCEIGCLALVAPGGLPGRRLQRSVYRNQSEEIADEVLGKKGQRERETWRVEQHC